MWARWGRWLMTMLTMTYRQNVKMLPDIVFHTHLHVFCRALWGYPPARVEHMTVPLQTGARAVRTKPRASPIGAPTSKTVAQPLSRWRMFFVHFPYAIVHIAGVENCWADLLSCRVTRLECPVCVHASVKHTEVYFCLLYTSPSPRDRG